MTHRHPQRSTMNCCCPTAGRAPGCGAGQRPGWPPTDAADIESLNRQAFGNVLPRRRYLHGLQRSEQHRARDSV